MPEVAAWLRGALPPLSAAVAVAATISACSTKASKTSLRVEVPDKLVAVGRKRVSPREKKILLHPGLSVAVAELPDNPDARPVPEPALENGVMEAAACAPDREARVLVLVGMRGSGKTSNGQAAAKALNRDFVDLDNVLEAEVGCTIPQYIDANDWATFRAKEADILVRALACEALGVRSAPDAELQYKCFGTSERGAVVATGGGVVETAASVDALSASTGVIFVDRHIEDILATLEDSGSYRPGLGEHPSVIYKRRLPLYKRCSDWCFTIAQGDTNFAQVDRDFARLCARMVKCIRSGSVQ